MWALPLALTLQAALIGLYFFWSFRYAPLPRLLAFDAVALPGEPIVLEARVETYLPPLLHSRSSEPEVQFRPLPAVAGATVDEPPAGPVLRGRLGTDGIVRVPMVAPLEAGVHRFRAEIAGVRDARGGPISDEVVVQVIPPDAELCIATPWDTVVREERPPPGAAGPRLVEAEGARSVLQDLARKHSVVYVDSEPKIRFHLLRTWLRDHGFPAGAVLGPPAAVILGEAEFELSGLLQEVLLKRWKRVAWTFAATSTQAEAFSDCGLRSILVGQQLPPPGGGGKVFVRPDWKSVERLVEGN